MCTCSAFDTGWVKEAIAQWGGGGGEKGEEAKERQEEEQAKQEICQGREKLQDPVTSEYLVTSQTTCAADWGDEGDEREQLKQFQKVAEKYIFRKQNVYFAFTG